MPCDETHSTSDAPLSNPDIVVEFDPADGKLITTAVVDVVSQSRGVDVRDLDPLYRAVDPDAITSLVQSMSRSDRGRIQFTYSECTVSVYPCGLIEVYSEEPS